jgi:hypothetical protein
MNCRAQPGFSFSFNSLASRLLRYCKAATLERWNGLVQRELEHIIGDTVVPRPLWRWLGHRGCRGRGQSNPCPFSPRRPRPHI